MAKTTTNTPADRDFELFWDSYGVKRDKIAARRAWNALGKRDRRAALQGIARYRTDCEQQNVRMIYPQGYLTHRRWEDESPTPNPSPTGVGSSYRTDSADGQRAAAPLPSREVAGVGSVTSDDTPDMATW